MDSREIIRQNPQWTGKKLALNTVRRDIEPKLVGLLEENIVIGITGLRQVGKTTLLQRIIDTVDVKTLYYSFDIGTSSVKDLLDAYFQDIVQTQPDSIPRTLVFLDEIQKADAWGDEVKAYHDRYDNLQFVVSGSSSSTIRKGAGESLVGRMNVYHLPPFTFREYLRYNDVELPTPDVETIPLPANAAEIETAFSHYLRTGGFPGLFELDEMRREERLKNMVDLSLYRDIVTLFDVGRPELLEGIFWSVVSQSGQKISMQTLSKSLNASYKTVLKYVDALEQSFLLRKSRRFEQNTLKTYRKRAKVYAADHSVCSLQQTEEGLVAETVAHNHLSMLGDVGYWESPRTEVDVVLATTPPAAYEIKWRNTVSHHNGFDMFKTEYPDSSTTLVTKNTLNREKNWIPLWLLLVHISY